MDIVQCAYGIAFEPDIFNNYISLQVNIIKIPSLIRVDQNKSHLLQKCISQPPEDPEYLIIPQSHFYAYCIQVSKN